MQTPHVIEFLWEDLLKKWHKMLNINSLYLFEKGYIFLIFLKKHQKIVNPIQSYINLFNWSKSTHTSL